MANSTAPIMTDATGQKIYHALETVSVASSTRNIGELVFSSLPLSDATLHLANGGYVERGAYMEFYDYVVSLLNSGNSAVVSYSTWSTEKTANGGPIGKYGLDTANQRVYLPDLTDTFVEGTNTELGTFKNAGIPNLKGKFYVLQGETSGYQYGNSILRLNSDSNNFMQVDSATSVIKTYSFTQTTGDGNSGINLNASRVSSVYSDSETTVQPQAIKQYVYIVLANAYRLPVTINIDEVMTDINTIHDQITDINSDITDLSNAISSISSHFDVGNAVFNSTSSTGLQTKQVNFNKTFSQIPTVIVCWTEPTAQNISAYCAHLQVASGSTTKTGFTAATYRSNAGGSWQFTYFAYEPF